MSGFPSLKSMKWLENENIRISSTGLFGSWCLHKPSRTLFDCGDGTAMQLGHRIFAPERIFIGHSHMDHLSGLLAFIGLRNRTKGANEKPLGIYGNMADPNIRKYASFVSSFYPQGQLKYKLTFNDIRPMGSVELDDKSYIVAFKTEHTEWSMGFCFCRISHRLAPGVDPNTIGKRIRSGEVSRESVTVRSDIKEFAYVLDCSGFDYADVAGVKEIVLDCTFLSEDHRDEKTHMTFEECKAAIRAVSCRRAYLAHLSPRYGFPMGSIIVWDEKNGLSLDGRPLSDVELELAVQRANTKE